MSDDRLLLLERARACTRRDTWSSCSTAVDVDSLMKKSESQHESPEDGCPFGPLTQRLLQALVEVGMLGSRAALIKKTTNYEKKRNSILCFFFFFFKHLIKTTLSLCFLPGEHYIPHGGFTHTGHFREGC